MLAIAADCESPFVAVALGDTLALTLETMARAHYQQLPVMDPSSPNGFLGLISYDALLSAYSQELSSRKAGELARSSLV